VNVFAQEATKIEADSKAAQAAQEQLRQLLEKKIPNVKLAAVNFSDVIDYLREKSGANIYVNWGALESEIPNARGKRINVVLNDVSLKKVLQVALDDAGEGKVKLGYILSGGVLMISTQEQFAHLTACRLYPVADLLCQTRRPYTRSSGIPWRSTSFMPKKIEPIISEGEKGSVWGSEDSVGFEPDLPTAEEAAVELKCLLQSNIDRESWYPNGTATVAIQGTNLIITQTHENHELVEKMLRVLRQARDIQKLRIGFAVIRLGDPKAAAALRQIAAKGGDIVTALVDGEDKGLWTLDRCQDERVILGDVLRATHFFQRQVQDGKVDGEAAIILDQTTFIGYEVGVLPKNCTGETVSMSVACGSAWVNSTDDVSKNTPQANTGSRGRHNTFDFDLQPGRARFLPVIPMTAKNGGVKVMVWLPKAARKTSPDKK
jgi:hypothetical protein